MKAEKLKGRKVKIEIDRRFYIGVRTGVVDQVVTRRGRTVVRVISDNRPDEGKRADYVDPDQIIAYFDKNRNQWNDL